MVQDYLGQKLGELGLSLKETTERERVVITVEGDMNDADYATEITEILLSDEKDVDEIIKIIEIIQEYHDELVESHGIEDIECEDWFDELADTVDIPTDEYGYCHTITDISVDYFTNSGRQYRII